MKYLKMSFWFLYDYETFVHLFSDIFFTCENSLLFAYAFTDFMDATFYFAEDVMFFLPLFFDVFFFLELPAFLQVPLCLL